MIPAGVGQGVRVHTVSCCPSILLQAARAAQRLAPAASAGVPTRAADVSPGVSDVLGCLCSTWVSDSLDIVLAGVGRTGEQHFWQCYLPCQHLVPCSIRLPDSQGCSQIRCSPAWSQHSRPFSTCCNASIEHAGEHIALIVCGELHLLERLRVPDKAAGPAEPCAAVVAKTTGCKACCSVPS